MGWVRDQREAICLCARSESLRVYPSASLGIALLVEASLLHCSHGHPDDPDTDDPDKSRCGDP